jgi:serine protease
MTAAAGSLYAVTRGTVFAGAGGGSIAPPRDRLRRAAADRRRTSVPATPTSPLAAPLRPAPLRPAHSPRRATARCRPLVRTAVAAVVAFAAAAAQPAVAVEPAPARQPGWQPPAAAGTVADGVVAERRGDPPPRAPRLRPAPPAGGEPLSLPGHSTAVHARAAGHVVVRFAASLAAGEAERIARGAGGGAVRRALFGDFSRVEVAPGTTPEQMVERLRGQPGVAWVEVDPLVRAAYSRAAAPVTASQAPTDPLYPRQWHLHRIGLEEALDRNPTDGAGVIVAVIDSGVASGGGAAFPARTAPDLEGTHVLPGIDLVDGGPPWDEGTASDPDRPFQSLRFGHGTFVASVIAATIDNGIAGASVAPRASILPVRVLGVDGFGTSSQVAEGIHFAIRERARVINLSLGGTQGASSMAEAVAAAGRAGVVVVAAAGNDADESVFDDELGRDVAFPARYPQAIAVGATGFGDQRASYSNFGPSLDIMAPGGDGNDFVAENVRDGILATSFLHDPRDGQTLYGAFWANGTSFAAPHVAGVAALLIGLGVDDPQAVRVMLEQTARDLAAPGFDETTAHGLLDAAKAHRGIGFTF